MELKDYLTIFVPTTATLIGFIINFILNKRLNLELVEQNSAMKILQSKSNKQIEDLYGLQKEIFDFLDLLYKLLCNEDILIDNFEILKNKIEKEIICVGSEDAVKVILYIRANIYSKINLCRENLEKLKLNGSRKKSKSSHEKILDEYGINTSTPTPPDPSEILVPYVVLAMQIKYDTTGIKTSPMSWFIGRKSQNLAGSYWKRDKYYEYRDFDNFYKHSLFKVKDFIKSLHLNTFIYLDLSTF